MKRKTNNGFSSVAEQPSVRALEKDTLATMQNYQQQLINLLLYGDGKKRDDYQTDKILWEIQRVERWLKDKYTQFINEPKYYKAA